MLDLFTSKKLTYQSVYGRIVETFAIWASVFNKTTLRQR